MAQNSAKVEAGAAIVSIAAYTTGGAASTTHVYVEVGHTEVVGWTPAMENFDVESEQSISIIKTVPVKDTHTLKIPAMESRPDILRDALGQLTSRLTGTAPNQTLTFGDRVEQYHRIKLVAPGNGTTNTRTIEFWKCQITALDEIQFGKKTVQKYGMSFRVLRDETAAAGAEYGQQVDT